MPHDFYARAAELSARGEPFVTATVVRAERPTSAKPGDKAIVTADGVLEGWIGGSCAQPAVLAEAQHALAHGQARLLRLSTTPEAQAPRAGLIDLPMTCFSGGALEIYLEPQLPTPRLLVVGGGPVAHALLRLGALMRYRVLAADLDGAPTTRSRSATCCAARRHTWRWWPAKRARRPCWNTWPVRAWHPSS
jgi:xanthine dehydrogenase accessory factor